MFNLMKKQYISPKLAEEIDMKLLKKSELDSYKISSICQKRRIKAIEASAQLQSFRIEHPHEEVPFSVPRNKNRCYIKEGIKSIQNAMDWGRKNFNPGTIDDYFIKGIAGRITPKIYGDEKIANYRTSGTRILGATVTPPDPYKMREIEMPKFLEDLKESLKCPKPINKIESAIFAHLHLARIHPFEDGNGRSSRVLQNIILDSYNVPVPVIYSGERNTYYDLLDDAVKDWKHNGGKERGIVTMGERRFYDFIAGKVNVSLDGLLEKCGH